ncbi:MAG: hypothetical protein Q8O56_05315 [Solirubrobacteraceae bacterium]|nr:hypothetical protein [Solirubrobacteraceae bacterium]
MLRCDWLLVFLAAAPGDALDPVRVQKGMFLLAMQAPLAASARYAFEPYAYGPMSRDLYRDVRRLRGEHRLDATPVAGASWQLLTLTATGRERAAQLRRRAGRDHPEALAQVDALRREISGLSFAELLEQVYERYPAYAVRSVFRRPA